MTLLDQGLVPVLNHLLAGASWATARLKPHAGQVLAIQLPPLPTLQLGVSADGFFATAPDKLPTVEIQLPASAPLLGLQDPQLVFQQARVQGNAEFAEAVSFVFRNLDWDAEEDLSRLFGDVFAHRLVGLARSARSNLTRGRDALAANLVEYVRDEAGLLLARDRFATHSHDLIALRDDLARLEKRIGQLGRP